MRALKGKRTQEHRKVEIGSRKRLDKSQADEEVSTRNPARIKDIRSEEGDNDRAASENHCAS
jgi:hypothetical protein